MHSQPIQPLADMEALRKENERLQAEKQLLWNSLRSIVKVVETQEPDSEYRQSVLSNAYNALWPGTKQ